MSQSRTRNRAARSSAFQDSLTTSNWRPSPKVRLATGTSSTTRTSSLAMSRSLLFDRGACLASSLTSWSLGRRFTRCEGRSELVPRVDAELREHLVEVILDGARADVEPGRDFGIRDAGCVHVGDSCLLAGELP